MITLQKRLNEHFKLYESLLDDEEELVNNGDENITKNQADKIFKGYKYNIENDGKVSFFGPLSTSSLYTKDIVENIFGGKYLSEFKRFSSILIHNNCIISNILTHPISIDKIDYLFSFTKSLKGLKKYDINIKEITELEICIDIDNQSEWVDLFKNTKIKTLFLKPVYSKGFNMKNIPPISGLNIDKVIIYNDMIPGYESGFFGQMDWNKVDEYINFIKSNNKVNNIYIMDVTETLRTKFRDRYIKVKKIK